jgi:glycogenin
MWVNTNYRQSSLNVKDVDEVKKVSKQIDGYVSEIVASTGSFYRASKSCAYVTLASPAYDFGLRVLLASIRKNSEVPIIILAIRPWDFKPDLEGVYFLQVPSLYNERYASHRHEINSTLTKLWIFSLLSINRLVFLDADCLVLKSIDDLFGREGLCCAPDCIETADSGRFNSGVMAFDTSVELRDFIYDQAYLAESYDHGDQGLLNSLLQPRVKYIPVEYNLTRHYAFFHGPDTTLESARVIHYVVKKPWELSHREPPDAMLNELDDLWTKQLPHRDLLDLVSYWRRHQYLAERSQQPTWAAIFARSRRLKIFSAAIIIGCFSLLICLVVAMIIFLFGH